ncbi:GDSL-type esterase/lipase family protein [Pseudactinotalea sp. Z1748]|uniref:GDSL-type esterase/lipase family protein n=1 Tax=Pseudactinotalea sp. Z1748 TaxID=3413027 RepID=UPI003C7DA876
MSTEAGILRPCLDSPFWRGAVGWVPEAQWWQPWRVLPDRIARAHAPTLLEVARMPTGVRAEFRTDAGALRLPVEYSSTERVALLDVVVDGELHARMDLPVGVSDVRVSLPPGTHQVQLWLPQAGPTRIGELELQDAEVVEPIERGRRLTTYGSSITLCSAAYGPSRTWPALVAQSHGWDLTCLGYSGQCHLDPIAARTIAAVPADVIALCLGINIYGGSTFNERSFAPHVSGFIEQVREAHPNAPITVITPIASPEREATPNHAGMTLEQMRTDITEVVQVLQTDDDDVHLVDGLQILGLHEAHLLPDGLHPDGEGYELMARRLAPILGSLSAAAP